MGIRQRVARMDLVVLVLAVGLVELALNRLAVPILRPAGAGQAWHRNLDVLGLFVFHLATALAVGVALSEALRLARRRDLMSQPARLIVAMAAAVFLGLAVLEIVLPGRSSLGFHLESSGVALFALLALTALVGRDAPHLRLGLLALFVPFALHYYGTFTLRLLTASGEAQWSPLPDRLRDLGNWAIVSCALASPVLFGPRPLRSTITRAGPLATATFVATLAAAILRRHYDVGMELASRGLGIDLGPAAPTRTLALYVLALAALSWTLAASLGGASPARRRIGAGLAIISAAGYAFAWPLTLLMGAVGALAIVDGSSRVTAEEHSFGHAQAFHPPTIPAAAWRSYLDAIASSLELGEPRMQAEGASEIAVLEGQRQGRPLALRIERTSGAVRVVEVTVGDPPQPGAAPTWTLFARPGGDGATGSHPYPPFAPGRAAHTGDVGFDRRFRLVDAGGLTARLLDEGRIVRATAILDGWVAVWPKGALRYQVWPGCGAPLDHPIPVTELAFRGVHDPRSVERIVSVVGLLADIAAAGEAAV